MHDLLHRLATAGWETTDSLSTDRDKLLSYATRGRKRRKCASGETKAMLPSVIDGQVGPSWHQAAVRSPTVPSEAFEVTPLFNLPEKNRACRKTPNAPFKILDAENLADDFYSHLMHWASSGLLCVGLGKNVFLSTMDHAQPTFLCDMEAEVTAVRAAADGRRFAISTDTGITMLYDGETGRCLHHLPDHDFGTNAIAWCGPNLLSISSEEGAIRKYDLRDPARLSTLKEHSGMVCGLQWSHDETLLASGGDDNKICVWDVRSNVPQQVLTGHTAAVRGLAWSPHKRHLLASGGGQGDGKIMQWNLPLSRLESTTCTNTQISTLIWSVHDKELVSLHTADTEHPDICVWEYPSMKMAGSITTEYRVDDMALSPDGNSVVVSSTDRQLLSVWRIFSGPSKPSKPSKPSNSLVTFTPFNRFVIR